MEINPTRLALYEARYASRGGHCIGDCTPTRDRGQSEVKQSRRNFEAGQVVKLGISGSLRTVKVSPGDRWAWLMLDSQGSRPDFRCGQGVKHENLLGQGLDPGRGWKYRRLCSVSHLGTDPPAGVIKVFIPPKIKVITLGYLLSAVAVDETDRQRSSTKNHHKALHFIFPGDRESANLARVFRREISRDLRLVPAQATPICTYVGR